MQIVDGKDYLKEVKELIIEYTKGLPEKRVILTENRNKTRVSLRKY